MSVFIQIQMHMGSVNECVHVLGFRSLCHAAKDLINEVLIGKYCIDGLCNSYGRNSIELRNKLVFIGTSSIAI